MRMTPGLAIVGAALLAVTAPASAQTLEKKDVKLGVGGQAGISGHLSIADDVVVSAWTLVAKSIAKPGVYTGNLPLQTHGDWVKNFSHLRHLDALARRVRQLEQHSDGPDDRSQG